jgi:predicted transcriptional regulator
MLEGIFGNKNAEKVLLHVFHYREIHASAIASDYGIALNPIKGQLDRFERAGILGSKEVGRSRLYFFNPKSVFHESIQSILKIAYHSIPLNERETLFRTRRRPRRKGKPVLRKNRTGQSAQSKSSGNT